MSKLSTHRLIVFVAAICLILFAWFFFWSKSSDSGGRLSSRVSKNVTSDEAPQPLYSHLGDLQAEPIRSPLPSAESSGRERVGAPFTNGGETWPGEAIVSVSDSATFHRVLHGGRGNGYEVIASLAALQSLRLRITDPSSFADWQSREREALTSESNFFVVLPTFPAPVEVSTSGIGGFIGMGSGLRKWLGAGDLSGSGVVVAVLDSGIDSHSGLSAQRIRRLEGFNGSVPQSRTSSGEAPDGSSLAGGHGTAVASIIAGTHLMAPGVAPGAQLLDVPVLGSDGVGDSFTLAAGIVAAVDAGARILNLSLGATGDSVIVRKALAYAFGAGAVVVASAGNEGEGRLSFPASVPGVLAVGAVDASGRPLPFSNQGEGLGLVAPGLELNASWPGDRLVKFSGTSGSAPVVAGAVAAVLSREPSLTPSEAAQAIIAQADDAGRAGPDPVFGYGLPNLSRVFQRQQPGIVDVALASHYIDVTDAAQLAENSGQTMSIQVVIQNRGTQDVHGILLTSTVNGRPETRYIPRLASGASSGQWIDFRPRADGQIVIESVLSGPFTDSNPLNNRQTVTLTPAK